MKTSLKIRLGVLTALFLFAAVSFYATLNEDRKGILTVAFLDVGQGDAIFIDSPNGNQMLIDGGPGKPVLRQLSKVMPFYDRSIDVILATHTDEDHIGGLPDVLKKYESDIFIEPGTYSSSSSYAEIESDISNEGIKKILARRSMEVDLGGGATLQILFPDRDPSGMDTNNASIVARLIYGNNEFLLTGDSPVAIEDYLVSLGGLKSDVLKIAHHGSKTSTNPEFVSVVSPEYAVISVGKDNKYGHPNKETLDTLNNFGAKILRTDQLGRIVFKSDGQNLELE
jgi:competence protein ComEC